MSTVYGRLDALSSYRDNRSYSSMQEQNEKLRESKTLYVGNLSFYTTEEQIYELFSRAGPIRRLIMGLDVSVHDRRMQREWHLIWRIHLSSAQLENALWLLLC